MILAYLRDVRAASKELAKNERFKDMLNRLYAAACGVRRRIITAQPRSGGMLVAMAIKNGLNPVGVKYCFPVLMANTFTQIHIQTVFAVEGRQNLIPSAHKDELYKYISGIVRNDGHKLLAIGGMPDHIHIFAGMRPEMALADFVRDVKANSAKFINENHWFRGKFNWQRGYGAFSYSYSHVDVVIDYVRNQERHHVKRTFREEYTEMLQKFNISYDEKYVFTWIE